MKKSTWLILSVSVVLFSPIFTQPNKQQLKVSNEQPIRLESKQAITRIAALYIKEFALKQRLFTFKDPFLPLQAELHGDVWLVRNRANEILIHISRSNGAVLELGGKRPPKDLLANEDLTRALAQLILLERFGENTILDRDRKPIILKDGGEYWVAVSEWFPGSEVLGGVYELKLRKNDGAILGVIVQR